jgi:hypothetical protein
VLACVGTAATAADAPGTLRIDPADPFVVRAPPPRQALVAVDNEWAGYLFVHEFGHHFAGLDDEYYTSPVAYQPAARVLEPWEANVTAMLDGQPLKWLDFAKRGTPLPTPWPKAEFEARQREEQSYTTQLFHRQRQARCSLATRCRSAVSASAPSTR